jgi:hypothetical protein
VNAPLIDGTARHPTLVAAAEAFRKPYKGPESYQAEDGALFHGRLDEAEQLVARILSSRFTLLHAQSGAGKTSLLNACVMPALESRGWFPVRVLLRNDPLESTRSATLQYLLPPPETEVTAIVRACRLLDLDERTATVADVLSSFDALPTRDPRKREIVAPVDAADLASAYPLTGGALVTPYACRVIRASLDLKTAAEQWNLVRAVASGGADFTPLEESAPIADLIAALDAPEFKAAYRSVVALLDPPGRSTLAGFFANLVAAYGQRFSRFGLVLVFDQFEEIFTRFVDPGPLATHRVGEQDWKLRKQFFAELQELYQHETPLLGAGSMLAPLPIRFVLSMRTEYIGKLDAPRAFVPSLDHCTYHLQLLRTQAAEDAIKAPAREFGYGYAKVCYEEIIRDLRKEENFVEPTHLQVVCESLWNASGRDLAASAPAGDTGGTPLPEVPLENYRTLGGVAGIMKSFLNGFLNELDERDRLEALDMLECLITRRGTRNIVDREYIVNAPLRDPERRARLLDRLVDRTIVRAERRLNGQFLEITHEFLIGPLTEALQDPLSARSDYRSLEHAIEVLAGAREMGRLGGTEQTLSRWQFEALDAHQAELRWPRWAVEAMFRNAVWHGAVAPVIQRWAGKLRAAGASDG